MGKTLGEMTPEERRAAIRRALDALQKELRDNAKAIGEILDSPPNEEDTK